MDLRRGSAEFEDEISEEKQDENENLVSVYSHLDIACRSDYSAILNSLFRCDVEGRSVGPYVTPSKQ